MKISLKEQISKQQHLPFSWDFTRDVQVLIPAPRKYHPPGGFIHFGGLNTWAEFSFGRNSWPSVSKTNALDYFGVPHDWGNLQIVQEMVLMMCQRWNIFKNQAQNSRWKPNNFVVFTQDSLEMFFHTIPDCRFTVGSTHIRTYRHLPNLFQKTKASCQRVKCPSSRPPWLLSCLPMFVMLNSLLKLGPHDRCATFPVMKL